MSEYDKPFPKVSLSGTIFVYSEFGKAFLAGSISGTISTILFQPLDVLKTRIQQSQYRNVNNRVGYFHLVKSIKRKDHFQGFWKGLSPSLLRAIPSIGLYFAILQYLNHFVESSNQRLFQTLALGVVARSLTCICVIPATVIKTRIESGEYSYGGVKHAFRVIYLTEGLRGLTAGLVPTIIRDAPYSGLYLMFYKDLKRISEVSFAGSCISKKEFDSGRIFICGVIAGCLASLLTHPADVIKTKMQLCPKEFKSFLPGLKTIYEQYGLKGYSKGLLTRLFRRTLITAMTWTVYEQIAVSINLK